MKNNLIILIKETIKNLFQVGFITWIVFNILEYLKQGLISNYFDLNLLLIFWVISGLIFLILNYD